MTVYGSPRQKDRPGKKRSPRWARIAVVLGVVVLLFGGGAYAVNLVADHYANQVKKDDFLAGVPQNERASEPPSGAPVSGPMNILLLGSDNADNSRAKSQGVDGQRSDSIVLFHIDKTFSHVYAFSIERDSYVHIPAAGSWQGGRTKLNAALQYGGPALAVRTVQDLLGIKIDHVVVVSFAALIKAVDAVGGVDVYVDKTTYDDQFHRTWTKGWHHLNGTDAQFFVRQRHGLAGGDYDRMKRQQQVMRALVKQATTAGVLSNPYKLNDLIQAVTSALVVDSGMPVKDLAFAARGLGLSAVTFSTLPTSGTMVIGGTDYERVNKAASEALGKAISSDDFTAYFKQYPPNDASHGL
ncbi:LCP family protein [Fodinicola acaciae]|uniref:LCP family protein n=1 Tax=Fodinicola acaciae TaxID=2681555 RepID=UPI0013D8DF16|nr:LCP family protein [Fodinicola acaciae]